MPGNLNMPTPSNKAIDIDVVFLQDCTESQQPYIDTVRKYVKDAIPMIKSQADLKGGSARYRLIGFRDHKEQGCDWLVKLHDFTTDPSVLANQLEALIASGGGDGPEAQIDGLDAARRSPWRQTAKKIVILMTDSPPHGIGEPGDSVPVDHPEALTHEIILKSYNKNDIQLSVLACVPEITYYEKAEQFYQDLTQKTSGLYVPLPEPHINPEPMKRAIVGCVLHSTNSLRTTDRWEEWIKDQSDRGHDAIVNDIHSKLTQEGETCHKVSCTEHRGTNDVHYKLTDVNRDFVDAIVGKTLRLKTDMKANPHMYDEH
ncbi:hypothetical protein K443DRAFT_679748 [Laccaria amethystina LaAM-08-1]|uniref:Hemicentin-1-like von Willebrand factor A domain-containing protein n=1 Tax=Laccaria amethystina LaAM-08-1 TaxID=1095629 RepID=A0A0C9XUV2_9AGAR|nr:hypothetical protein K443DRAFT_679748 [Laccaria amethystina LaAM-08-1]